MKPELPGLYAGYIFDLDGTVYLGDSLLPGAAETIAALRDAGSQVMFVTNKPLETRVDYAQKLSRLGVPTDPEEVLTAVESVSAYLREHHPEARILPISEASVAADLSAGGFTVVDDPATADVVLVSFDRTFDYAKLLAAYRAVRLFGATIIATNPDRYCPTPDGGLPDCAAMLAALEACTSARASAVLGKPSKPFAHAALDQLGLEAGEVAMVGDRLDTDMAMANAVGMASVLVLSGATSRADLLDAETEPDFVLDGISSLWQARH